MDRMMTAFIPAQTSVPEWLMTYCRQLADVHYSRKLNRMYVHMLQGFLACEPWKATPPFKWRVARLHRGSALQVQIRQSVDYSPGLQTRRGVDLGWVPMNITIPTQLADQIKHTIEAINVSDTSLTRALSLRTFLYTVVCWWCSSVHPYSGPGMLDAS